MTTRDQIRHLLRRFGFGPNLTELAEYEKIGLAATIEKLIDWEKVDDGFPVSPWEICFEADKTEMYFDAPRIGAWWALRMMMTRRPLQENLSLFWHNHFAVSAQKIEFGPMMAQYVETIRAHANGRFPDLLQAVSTTPAMVKWLDTDASIKGHPNENFGRELLELFTLGIGSYTEQDVKEAARTFTGWGLRYLVYEGGGENLQKSARDSVKSGLPLVAFCVTPDLQDRDTKKFLGKSGAFDGYETLRIAAERPETSRRLVKKLWEWFAYPNPSAAILDRLSGEFEKSGGDIKNLLRSIIASPEFWSPQCVRTKVKSPADFIVGILRQFGLQPFLELYHTASTGPDTPLPKPLRDVGGLLWASMYQQGLALLYPPDVGGWHWGPAWLNTANMAERMKFANLIFGVDRDDKTLATLLSKRLADDFHPTTSKDVVHALLEVFDAQFEADKIGVLVSACDAGGGVAALASPKSAAVMFTGVCRLIFSSPEFQMC